MKKALHLLLISLVLGFTHTNAATLWSGNEAIDWNNSKSVGIDASAFSTLDIADRLLFNIEFTGNTDWPQVSLTTSSWKGLAGAGNTGIAAGVTQVVYTVTNDMLTTLTEEGMIITGCGYTLLSVETEKGPGPSGYENAIWIGETELKTDWSTYQTLPAISFSKTSVGDIMRIRYKDVKAGASILPKNSSWSDLPDAPGKTADGVYVDYEVTSAMLASLKSGGTIIQGVGVTLTSVDILPQQTGDKVSATVPVYHNWCWTAGEQPTLRVQLQNPLEEDKTVKVEIMVTTDKLASVGTLTRDVTVTKQGTRIEEIPLDVVAEPGFYRCTVMADGDMVRAFNIGYAPEDIVSAPDMQSDFATFWQTARAELDAVAPQYTLTKIDSKSTSKRNVYLVEMKTSPDQSGSDITIRGYYAEPTAAGTYPALIHYQGYDGGTDTPWCMGGDDNPDWCEFILSTRGQVVNNRPPYTNVYGDWFAYGFDHQDHYYYRGAFMDAVRAIDFMCSREKVQQQNIFAEGASQGGALTLAAAALDDRLNAIAPGIPFLGDYPDYFQIASWPGNVAFQQRNKLGWTDEQMYTMLSYFDTKNLATMITCPVTMNFSLQDNVCPPHTNVAPYNNLASTEKEYSVNATLAHQTSGAWWTTFMQFFRDHMKSTEGIDDLPAANIEQDGRVYNLQGQCVGTAENFNALPAGLYIVNGKKEVRK